MTDNSITVNPKGDRTETGLIVENMPFFPDLDVDDFRESMRVDGTVPSERLKSRLIEAALKVNADLEKLPETYPDADKLSDIPSANIAGISTKLWRYKAAVFNEAKADLVERFRDFDSTKSGHDEADKLEIGIDDYRQKSREHIRALLETPRARIVLI